MIKDIQTTENYWDCECVGTPEEYIHPKSQTMCTECKQHQDDMPDSRMNEVHDAFGHYGDKKFNLVANVKILMIPLDIEAEHMDEALEKAYDITIAKLHSLSSNPDTYYEFEIDEGF